MFSEKSKLGCLPVGCLVATVIGSLVLLVMLLAIRWGIRNAVVGFTSEQKVVFESSEASSEDLPSSTAKIKALSVGCTNLQKFTFNRQELNSLIASDRILGSMIRVSEVTNQKLALQFSVPLGLLSNIPFRMLLAVNPENRYINGQAVLSKTKDNSNLELVGLELNGSTAPNDSLFAASKWLQEARVFERLPELLSAAFRNATSFSLTENGELEISCGL